MEQMMPHNSTKLSAGAIQMLLHGLLKLIHHIYRRDIDYEMKKSETKGPSSRVTSAIPLPQLHQW